MTETITLTQNQVRERIIADYLNERRRVENHYRSQGWNDIRFIPELEGKTIAEKMEAFAVNGGVELRAPCGCQRLVNPDGTEELIVHCDDHPDGIPNTPERVRRKKLIPFCGEHAKPMVRGKDGEYHCSQCEVNDR